MKTKSRIEWMKLVLLAFIFMSTSYACSSTEEGEIDSEPDEVLINESVTVRISSPAQQSTFVSGINIEVKVHAQDSDGIQEVVLYIDDALHSTDVSSPFNYVLSDLTPGAYVIKAKVIDVLGYETETNETTITINEAPTYTPGEYATEFDGGILVPERTQKKLVIYKGGTDSASMNWSNSENILWSMNLHNAEGVAAEDMDEYNNHWRGGTSINEAKRVIHNGKNHLIVVGNGGDGIAMYEFDTKKCVYWGEAKGGPHSVEYLPGGILALANPASSGSKLELYKTNENNKGPVPGSQISFGGIHGVVWSDKQQILWVWGGSKLRSFSFNKDLENPKLTELTRYEIPSDWEGAGHDASPMSGTSKLLLACNQGIITFDTETKEFEIVKLTSEDKKYKNNKGLSYNPITQEIILIKSDDSNGSYRIRSVTKADRNMGSDKRAYKARWFYVKDF